MSIKKQLMKIKDNWILILAIFILVLFMNLGGVRELSLDTFSGQLKGMDDYSRAYAESAMTMPMIREQGFAPEEDERKITKTTSINTEVERGEFRSSEQTLKEIISSSESFILNENVHRYETKRNDYFRGNYNLKVDTNKYDEVISKLKEIGDIQSFNENSQDITGRYTDNQINLETEKTRLKRYQEMYDEAKRIEDKLNINNRIFDQERRIKYLEESLKNMDQRIDYSTIQVTITEKRSEYAGIIFVKFSELVQNLVRSVNNLVGLIFTLLPWMILGFVIWIIWRFAKQHR